MLLDTLTTKTSYNHTVIFDFQPKRPIWKRMQFFMLLIYYTLKITTATEEYNYEERSQKGISLFNHTYKSLHSANYSNCLIACVNDSKCMSLNYWWYTSRCDLNNKTKYSAEPKSLIREISSTYMGLMREQGINSSLTEKYLLNSLTDVTNSILF